MISGDDEIRVIWNVRAAFIFGSQQTLVKRALRQCYGAPTDGLEEFGNVNFVVLLSLEPQP